MSRRPRTSKSRSFLSSLNPFARSVDRAMDFKRQGLGYSRGLRCEQLEDRRLLAVDTLTEVLRSIGQDLQEQIANNPIDDAEAFEDFELLFKQQFAAEVVKPVVEFFDTYNPIPQPVSDFLTDDVLSVPGLTDILEGAGIPNTPIDILTTFAEVTAPELKDAIDGLEFFLDINSVISEIDAVIDAGVASTLADYDDLFGSIQNDFPITAVLIDQFNAAEIAASGNIAQLEMVADDLSAALADLQAVGTFTTTTLDFNFFADSARGTIFEIAPRIPVYGASGPSFAAGVTIGGELNGMVSYAIDGAIDFVNGLTINNAEAVFDIGFTGDGSAGLTLGGFSINAAEVSARISGEVGVALAESIDADGNGFQASEIISADCYFDTTGGLRFRSDVSYLDPNPVNQIGSLFGGDGPAERSVNLFDVPIWSAQLSSCDPTVNRSVMANAGVLEILGTEDDDIILVSLNNDAPGGPTIVVSRNGAEVATPLDGLESISIDVLGGNDQVVVSEAILLPALILGGEGSDELTGGGGDDQIDSGPGEDTLNGGEGDDLLFGGDDSDVLLASSGADILEGEADADKFIVSPDVLLSIEVDGGAPAEDDPGVPPGDVLAVDLSGVSGTDVPLNVSAGAIGSTSHGTVFFENIELVVGSDRFEANDKIAQATDLGSSPFVSLEGLSIHADDDEDFFSIVAHETGRLVVDIDFEHAFGDLDLHVLDSDGNLIAVNETTDATGDSATDDERLIIPVVGQQEYFVRVFGFNNPEDCNLNNYSLEIENFPAPVPTGVHLDPASDTGSSDHDNVTADNTPTFFIQTNVLDFVDSDGSGFFVEGTDAITALNPGSDGQFTDAINEPFEDGQEPGIAVEVTLFNTTDPLVPPVIAFAEPVADSFPEVYRFTPTEELADGVYFVASRTKILDGQTPMAMGRSEASEPLWITIDTEAPDMPAPDLLSSSDSGMNDDDNVTNVMQPAFTSTAEENAIVHVFAQRIDPVTSNPTGDVLPIGSGVVGTDNTDGVPNDNMGRWEVTVEPLTSNAYDITTRFEDASGQLSEPSDPLRIVIDKEAPNTPFLDLIDDTGRHDHDEVTKENEPVVTMTSSDPNIQLAQVLFDDNLKFRIYDRYENTAEFLLYDSAADAAEDADNFAGDMFTANTLITETLAAQFIAGNPANAAVLAGGVLADGVHNLKLEVEDRAGNISHDFLLTVTVDTLTPPVSFGLPAVVNAEDGLDASSDSGVTTMPATYADRVTNDTTPALWGRAEANTIIRVYHDDDGDGVIDLSTNPAVGDTFLGQTVAVPYDGNDAYPDGFWQINSVLDLNQILGLPKDGVRQLLVTAEDLAGNPMPMNLEIADGVDSLNIFIDTQGPQVYDPAGAEQAVHPAGFPEYDLFDPKPSENGFTPLTRQITINVRDLPVRSGVDPNFRYEALKQDIAETLGNYMLVGDHVGPIGIVDVVVTNDVVLNGQQATATIDLVFADFLPDDRYTLTVSDNLVDPAGNNLDGESNASGPLDDPTFPTGDGVPGGAFVSRFTIDSRPEVGTFIPTTIAIDINGNFVWDPSNAQIGNDRTNVDLTFTMDRPGLVGGGFAVHDTVFAGKFVGGGFGGGAPVPPEFLFDQLGVYGYSAETAEHRWLIDLDSDGVTDIYSSQPVLTTFGLDTVGALPVAGNFDNDLTNGDEIGLYYAGNWGFDFNHNFVIEPGEIVANTGLHGVPIVGDFDGNGVDDVAVFNNNNFTFALSGGAFGAFAAFPQMQWGFSGVLERPVAADMDQDGIDDIGLFVPRNTAQPLRQTAEWYFLLSGFADQVDLSIASIAHAFEPVPFGNDLYAEFGDELALPIVGNFDPPVVASEVENNNFTQLPGDFDHSGMVDEADFTMWQESYGETGVNMAADANADGVVGLADYTMWREHIGMTAASGGDYDGSGAVDEGDYVTWHNQFGQTGTLLAADGNGDGTVDMADFSVWRNNLGVTASSLVFASAEFTSTQPAPAVVGLQSSPAAVQAPAATGAALFLNDSQDEREPARSVSAVDALFAEPEGDLLLIADRIQSADEGDASESDWLAEAEEQTERETDDAFAQL